MFVRFVGRVTCGRVLRVLFRDGCFCCCVWFALSALCYCVPSSCTRFSLSGGGNTDLSSDGVFFLLLFVAA